MSEKMDEPDGERWFLDPLAAEMHKLGVELLAMAERLRKYLPQEEKNLTDEDTSG